MPSPSTLAAFALASLILILIPGPAMLFLLARGVSAGPRMGAMSALGIQAATSVYVVATALGLTALLAASGAALAVIRWAGAAYLIFLGVRTLLDRSDPHAPTVQPAVPSAWSSCRQGFLVGIGNPKVALFFLAFFPQFLHADAGPVATQVLVLGAITVLIGSVLDTSYGVFGGLLSRRFGSRPNAVRRSRIAVGLTYLGLGSLTAATGSRAG